MSGQKSEFAKYLDQLKSKLSQKVNEQIKQRINEDRREQKQKQQEQKQKQEQKQQDDFLNAEITNDITAQFVALIPFSTSREYMYLSPHKNQNCPNKYIPIRGDGNCAFYSFIIGKYLGEKKEKIDMSQLPNSDLENLKDVIKEIRTKLVILNQELNQDIVGNFLTKHIEDIGKEYGWATADYDFQILCELLDVCAYVYQFLWYKETEYVVLRQYGKKGTIIRMVLHHAISFDGSQYSYPKCFNELAMKEFSFHRETIPNHYALIIINDLNKKPIFDANKLLSMYPMNSNIMKQLIEQQQKIFDFYAIRKELQDISKKIKEVIKQKQDMEFFKQKTKENIASYTKTANQLESTLKTGSMLPSNIKPAQEYIKELRKQAEEAEQTLVDDIVNLNETDSQLQSLTVRKNELEQQLNNTNKQSSVEFETSKQSISIALQGKQQQLPQQQLPQQQLPQQQLPQQQLPQQQLPQQQLPQQQLPQQQLPQQQLPQQQLPQQQLQQQQLPQQQSQQQQLQQALQGFQQQQSQSFQQHQSQFHIQPQWDSDDDDFLAGTCHKYSDPLNFQADPKKTLESSIEQISNVLNFGAYRWLWERAEGILPERLLASGGMQQLPPVVLLINIIENNEELLSMASYAISHFHQIDENFQRNKSAFEFTSPLNIYNNQFHKVIERIQLFIRSSFSQGMYTPMEDIHAFLSSKEIVEDFTILCRKALPKCSSQLYQYDALTNVYRISLPNISQDLFLCLIHLQRSIQYLQYIIALTETSKKNQLSNAINLRFDATTIIEFDTSNPLDKMRNAKSLEMFQQAIYHRGQSNVDMDFLVKYVWNSSTCTQIAKNWILSQHFSGTSTHHGEQIMYAENVEYHNMSVYMARSQQTTFKEGNEIRHYVDLRNLQHAGASSIQATIVRNLAQAHKEGKLPTFKIGPHEIRFPSNPDIPVQVVFTIRIDRFIEGFAELASQGRTEFPIFISPFSKFPQHILSPDVLLNTKVPAQPTRPVIKGLQDHDDSLGQMSGRTSYDVSWDGEGNIGANSQIFL